MIFIKWDYSELTKRAKENGGPEKYTQTIFDAGKEEGWDEGHDKGYDEGKTDGRKEGLIAMFIGLLLWLPLN